MKIQLKKLILINFKGIKSLEIDFADITNISGRNATGKSTIFDSFTWLLFGKDALDRNNFGVKTYDIDGIIIPKIEHEVTGVLEINGIKTTLKRVLREKWQKTKGEEVPEFKGNETIYFINDVPQQQQEYQAYINSIIPEATFKLLTSPTYFNNLKWNDRREMLSRIAGVPSEEEIAGNDLKDLLLIMANEKKTIEDLKKEYVARKKKLRDAIDQIPARTDEVTRNTPEAEDFKALEAEITKKKDEVAGIEKSIQDASESVQEAINERSKVLMHKQELEQKISSLEFQARNQFASAGQSKDSEINAKKQKIESLRQSKEAAEFDITTLKTRIDNLTINNNDLRERWNKRNAETIDFKDTNCPTCGQPFPADALEQKQAEATKRFNDLKTLDLSAITKTGKANADQIGTLNINIDSHLKAKQAIDEQISKLQSEISTLESQPVLTQSVEAILSGNQEYNSAKTELQSIVVPEVEMPDTTSLKIRKVEISEEISNLQVRLSKRDTIALMDKRKLELKAEEKSLAQQIADLEKIEFQIETYTKRKVMEVENRVNALFPTVRFRMFNTLINGGDEPACECLINGVPYSDANNGARINTGIEIINVFSKVHDTYCPVFVDNSESINTIIPTDSQLIRLVVSDEITLTVAA